MSTPPDDVPRRLLLDQLAIVWGFAERHVWPRVDLSLCTWEPSRNTVTVHPRGDGWAADWPDEETPPPPEATVGWLLWHVDWWWSNTVRACRGEEQVSAADHLWDGTVQSLLATKVVWEETLTTMPVEGTVEGLMREPKPLWFVAGWVNFELTKNVSEIHQLINRRENAEELRSSTPREGSR